MSEIRDTSHILLGQRIPRLTQETFDLAVEDRRETMINPGQSPGAWLVAAVAAAELRELNRFASELGLITEPSGIDGAEPLEISQNVTQLPEQLL